MKIDRDALIEKMAEQMTNDADITTLQEYFYTGTVDFLTDLSDADLLIEADWNDFDTTEYEQVE